MNVAVVIFTFTYKCHGIVVSNRMCNVFEKMKFNAEGGRAHGNRIAGTAAQIQY